jgi:hypothetical protein
MKRKSSAPIDHRHLSFTALGRNGLTLTVAIKPLHLANHCVSATVAWEGTDHPPRIILVEGNETAWGQRLALVVAATGPEFAPHAPGFRTGEWESAALTLPDLLGGPEDVVTVTVNSQDWKSKLSVTYQPELGGEREIPPALRHLDVATTAVEMFARTFLGRSWLTLELMPSCLGGIK